MTDDAPKKTPRDKAALLMQMTKEALRVERRTGAEACIVICMFRDGDVVTLQDAGKFPVELPPEHFYHVMTQAHKEGLLGVKNNKRTKPH